MSKSDRLLQIELLLLDHPTGLRRAEIASRLGIHKSTAGRDITALSSRIPILEQPDGRLTVERSGYLTTVRLTMFELEALHLSGRLFARVMKFPFPHASAALRKLAEAQGKVSPVLAERIRETAEDIDHFPAGAAGDVTGYRQTIETLGQAISELRPVRLLHYSRTRNAEREFHLFPVTLEPHHEGRAVHLLAWDLDDEPQQFRTLKIERIRQVCIEPPAPHIAECVPIEQLARRLRSAWSIWSTDRDPVPVVLHFTASVAGRVAETQWHLSQSLQPTPEGGILWRGEVSEPREMYPWIRSWGPDVEVIEPEWLRDEHRSDFEAGAQRYRHSP